jgi:hypothetical protein
LLSSVVYGPDPAMVAVLALAGSGALRLELPVGLALVVLIILLRPLGSHGGSHASINSVFHTLATESDLHLH